MKGGGGWGEGGGVERDTGEKVFTAGIYGGVWGKDKVTPRLGRGARDEVEGEMGKAGGFSRAAKDMLTPREAVFHVRAQGEIGDWGGTGGGRGEWGGKTRAKYDVKKMNMEYSEILWPVGEVKVCACQRPK